MIKPIFFNNPSVRILFFIYFILPSSLTSYGQNKIQIEAKPKAIYIERGETCQHLNFDFKITHSEKDTVELIKIKISVIDENNQVCFTRFLDDNGTAPSINLLSNRVFKGIGTRLIFNPFTDFSLSMKLNSLLYEFTFSDKSGKEIKMNMNVNPQDYQQGQSFLFPLRGKTLIYDAHDFYAHHRRFDFEFVPIQELGITTNFMRYAYDFVLLDETNKAFYSDGKTDADYIGYGKTVYAIGEGKVIYASNKHKDDKNFDVRLLAQNQLELYGNCIAIQHASGVISIYGHLKENSLLIKVGDRVRAGQELAQMGVSGSSFFPHLHFEIRTDIKNEAEGLPCYFSNVAIWNSKTQQKQKIKSGLVETGEIIEIEK